MSPNPSRRSGKARRRRVTLGIAAALTVAVAVPTAVTHAVAGESEGDSPAPAEASATERHTQFQRDADAVRDTGAIGVQARVSGGRHAPDTVTSGTADIRTGRPVPDGGHFRIASNTKTFVAAVVLQLVGERKVALTDPVEKWLPGVVRGNGNDGRKITLRQLLQHTSGIHDDYPGIESAKEYQEVRFHPFTPEQLVERAMRHRPDFRPGKGWSYSNIGYILLGMVIEKATGHTWHDQVRDRLLKPLGLRHTYHPGNSPTLRKPHARGYQRFSTKPKLVDVTLYNDANASGGLIGTTADLNRFYRDLLGGKVLKPAQLKEMKRTVPLNDEFQVPYPGARYGLGLMKSKLPCGGWAWGHGGDEIGYMSRNAVSEDGRVAVTTSVSTEWATSGEDALRQHRAGMKLVANALCRDGG
ncbi:serine hydrolase domain-containing protein [Streptomyces aureoverticillatus]|uniref:serine hydrolase domain-containing protein n=1 Tax=Streptomyces aureoverticillatus TaxID=66871 RepID=UPI0013DD49D7|nr:serine hydrolase domain-containing protein [Streptomyces aureoverticillatus]QIB46072.1 beta-lactamase family protein [Streptomyces aureoverticillatus]